MTAIGPYEHSGKQLALIQNTIAKDCNRTEFDLFVEVAKSKGLDPFIGQIIPMVFNKSARDQSKRKLTIIISRDGQRVIAQRCGDYRPASKPPTYEVDEALKSPVNPHGIVSATVYLWKQDARTSEWYEVAGQAYWEEFAPISYTANQYDYIETGDTWPDGNPKKDKVLKEGAVPSLDTSGNWAKMPRLMIAKCAEMQALRAGWPEQFSGLYDEAEIDRTRVADAVASDLVDEAAQEERLRRIGAKEDSITIWWGENYALENVPLGQMFDRCAEHVRSLEPAQVSKWHDANRVSLQMFWAKSKDDALALKKITEAAIEKAARQPASAA